MRLAISARSARAAGQQGECASRSDAAHAAHALPRSGTTRGRTGGPRAFICGALRTTHPLAVGAAAYCWSPSCVGFFMRSHPGRRKVAFFFFFLRSRVAGSRGLCAHEWVPGEAAEASRTDGGNRSPGKGLKDPKRALLIAPRGLRARLGLGSGSATAIPRASVSTGVPRGPRGWGPQRSAAGHGPRFNAHPGQSTQTA